MPHAPKLLVTLLLLAFTGHAHAQSFEDALAKAYTQNPAIEAKRAELKAANENVAKAIAAYRPTVSANAGIGRAHQNMTKGGLYTHKGTLSPRDVGIEIDQPLFRGFRSEKALAAAKAERDATQALLRLSEQNLLLQSGAAYLSLLQSAQIVKLTRNNEAVLGEQRDATESHLKVGEVTKTDLAQATARQNAAIAERLKAEGDYQNDSATFERLIGDRPEKLQIPQLKTPAPLALEDILARAQAHHPAILAARKAQEAAEALHQETKGTLLPELHLVGTIGTAWDQSLMLPARQNNAALMARLTFPLYRGGADVATIRQAGQKQTQRKLELDDARRVVREETQRAMQNLITARTAITAYESQRKADESALFGVQEEQKVGSRTTLDVLNARQELLMAEVNLVKARHQELMATLALWAALGELTPETLNLPLPSF